LTLLVITIAVALLFDFTNGFHDTANAVATSVSTRALSPRMAVLVAAVANLAGAFVTTAVAKTVGKGIIDTGLATPKTVLAAVIGAIAWNLLTWWFGLPSSSSHALIGGLVGAALVQSGEKGVEWHGITHKVLIPALWAPTIAFASAFLLLLAIYWVFQWMTPGVANRTFRFGQLATGTWVAFTHGANDAQKTMGVILALLIANNLVPPDSTVPLWVVLSAHTAIGLGTLFGGWRIVHTMGSKITRLQPVGGMCAETAAAATLFFTAHAGIPVSTTHTITGAIVGVGSSRRLSAVRWGVAGRVVWAWILTIPGAFVVAWICYLPFKAMS
jgi:PiT family inorganic phosphate transporter